jgi:Spy/CpxP family protein refolding chaperone
MTKTTKILLVAFLALTVAVPVFAWGPGGGKGGMMSGNYNQNTANPGQFMRGGMMSGNYNQNTANPGQFTRGGMMRGNYNQNTATPGQFMRGGMMRGNYNQNTANPGQFMRGRMMGGFERNQGYNNQNTNLTEEQVAQLNDLQKKYYDETAELREQMWAKSNELNTILNNADPDTGKVKALQTEVNDLRAQMSNARIDYDLEAKKINPDGFNTRGRMGRSGGMGGMGSFAPGVCF